MGVAREQIERINRAAELERPVGPEIVQSGRAVRAGGGGAVEIYHLTGHDTAYNTYICRLQKWEDGAWADANTDDVKCKNVIESDGVWAFPAAATTVNFIKLAFADGNGVTPVAPVGFAHMF